MKKWILPLTLTVTLFSPISHAYTVYGYGAKSCGAWTTERKTESVSLTRAGMESWILGFLGGAGWMGHEQRDADWQGMMAWIDNYCQATPLDDISDAAMALAIELTLIK